MRTRTTAALVLALAAAAGFVLHGRRAAPTEAPPAPRAAAPAGLVPRATYRLLYEQEVRVDGQPPMDVVVQGQWTTTPLRNGRAEVRFAPDTLHGPDGALPAAGDLAAPVQLAIVDGVLGGMAFPQAMPAPARTLLTTLAGTFQRSERPGERWTVTEEDVVGRYDAVYVRTGDTIARTRAAYRATRGPDGLSAAAAAAVTPAESTRFEVDADGLVRARVELTLRIAIGQGAPEVDLRVRASLERTALAWVAPPAAPLLAVDALSDHADHAGARRSADERFVDGASAAVLMAELARVAALDPAAAGVGNQRAQLVSRLGTAVRLDPALAAQVAAMVRAHGDRTMEVELLAGALSSAGVPEATDALAGLLGAELPAPARTAVMNALTMSEPTTATSLAALTSSLDGADAAQAAYALGAHRRAAGADLADAATHATRTLVDRARAASGPARTVYVQALGNTGDPAALPLLRDAIATGDANLAADALFSLRFVAGAEADALLTEALGDPERAFGAIRAIGYRDPETWRAALEAAKARYADDNKVQTALRGIFRRWT